MISSPSSTGISEPTASATVIAITTEASPLDAFRDQHQASLPTVFAFAPRSDCISAGCPRWRKPCSAVRSSRRAQAEKVSAPENPAFGVRVPAEIRPSDVQEWIAKLDEKLAARTVQAYWQVLAQVLDYADASPNVARHNTVKLPFADHEEATPPTAEHFLAMLEKLSKRLRLPAIFLEQTAARVAELRSWEWQDVDVVGSRIRSRGVEGRRGTRRVRWRLVPEWLMRELLATVPPDDRTPERRIFPGLKEGTMRDSMMRACRAAGIPGYSPHDLRHRRGSLWHASGVSARELAERMGHSKASMSLDVYTHVMAPEEARIETVSALIQP